MDLFAFAGPARPYARCTAPTPVTRVGGLGARATIPSQSIRRGGCAWGGCPRGGPSACTLCVPVTEAPLIAAPVIPRISVAADSVPHWTECTEWDWLRRPRVPAQWHHCKVHLMGRLAVLWLMHFHPRVRTLPPPPSPFLSLPLPPSPSLSLPLPSSPSLSLPAPFPLSATPRPVINQAAVRLTAKLLYDQPQSARIPSRVHACASACVGRAYVGRASAYVWGISMCHVQDARALCKCLRQFMFV